MFCFAHAHALAAMGNCESFELNGVDPDAPIASPLVVNPIRVEEKDLSYHRGLSWGQSWIKTRLSGERQRRCKTLLRQDRPLAPNPTYAVTATGPYRSASARIEAHIEVS